MRRRAFLASLGLGACAPAARPPAPGGGEAERVFVRGRVWTGEPGRPFAEALAVRGGVIAAVGTDAEARARAGRGAEVVDLRGLFVYPGFNDAHLHFVGGSLTLGMVNLAGAFTVEEIQRKIAAFARANPEAPWVVGRGWAYAAFPGGLPHRRLLDAAVPDRPAWMTSYDEHTGWANTAALRAAGVGRLSRDPEHGVIVKDEGGEPTGVFKEAAQALVSGRVPPPDAEAKYRLVRRGLDLAASYGLTSAQNAGFDEADLPIFDRLIAEGALTVRMYSALAMAKEPGPELLARYRALRARYRSDTFRFGAVKGFVDGVVEAQTAAMFDPYPGGGRGLANWTPEELDRAVSLYDREGFQIFLHAIGDRAIHMALNAYERAARENGPRARRHRVEHVEAPRFEDVARFGPLGVVASTQPTFIYPDKNHFEAYVPALGPERAPRAMAFKSIDDAGAVQAFGSDWPVFSCEVLRGLRAAVTRTTVEGNPPGGWHPEQRIGAEAALRHYTRDAAYASFDEGRKGTLAPGKLADFVAASADLSAGAESIAKAEIVLTVMGGRDTYRARGL
ncbi:MAG TPA: amidohydrolase [Polyangiaceae bacterium]|nr:amidohydrolase [Polyangiaceae bacterium]